MSDWSKYQILYSVLHTTLEPPIEDSAAMAELFELLTDVRRAERKRCAEACSEITGQHIKAESTMRTIEERAEEIAQGLGAVECKSAIEALGDDN